jgi:hypothetical protein
LQCVWELFFGRKKSSATVKCKMATVAKNRKRLNMRCNPLLLVTVLLCGTSGITRAAQSTNNDALPELPPLQGAKALRQPPRLSPPRQMPAIRTSPAR